MIELPDECPNTLEHVLIHLDDAYEHIGIDNDQIKHSIGIAEAIVKNILEINSGKKN